MRVGVVCEGPTDFPAITCFVGNALERRGISATFRSLFPDMDNTRPIGGWANVMLWLERNDHHLRVQRFFKGGLFGGALGEEALDAIVIQLDTDVLADSGFRQYVKKKFNLDIVNVQNSAGKAHVLTNIIELAACIESLAMADAQRHVPFPAVNSTEAWCVAAFHNRPCSSDELEGQDLTNHFMSALESSESKTANPPYSNIDKSHRRRLSFCKKHASNSDRIVVDNVQFASCVDRLAAVRS